MFPNDYTVSDGLVFKLVGDQFVAWNYYEHTQYALETPYLERLKQWAKGTPDEFSKIDNDLVDARFLVAKKNPSTTWGWDPLSHIFHYGTKDIPITFDPNVSEQEWVDEYIEYCKDIKDEMPALFTKRVGEHVALPKPSQERFNSKSLLSSLLNRKTCRQFNSEAVTKTDLSDLLYITFGLVHGDWNEFDEMDMKVTAIRKSSPSGGGLHPTEAYITVLRVEGLESGIYHYNCHEHSLTKIGGAINDQQLIQLLWGQYYCKGMAFGVFLTSRLDKAWWKYKHSRAYRNVLLDIGHLSQTLQLAATAIDLNTWLTGAFADTKVDELLQVNGVSETTLFFLGVGKGEAKAFDHLMHRRILENK